MRVAAYCRVSTDKDDQINSVEMQKKFFAEYAEKNRFELVRIYADEGISGTKIKNREEFKRLMRDARAGLFELVAVKDISRFARNTVDFLQSIRALKALGIETTFLTANMTVLGNSEFILTIFGALAQEESANTSKRIKFSKRINAEKGRVPNQVYGYDKTIGDYFHLSVNREEADWIQKMFQWYTCEGFGALKISHMLNSMGVKTKRGNAWSQVAVSRILRNELYTGRIINGKQEVADFLTGERTSRNAEDWFVTENPELAIIPREQFEKAQTILKERYDSFQMNRERQSNRYPFSTLIKCKECGSSFRRFQATYTNTYVRWICSGRNRNGTGSCENATKIEETELLAKIDERLAFVIQNKERLAKKVADAYRGIRKEQAAEQDRATDIRRRIAESEKRKQRYLDLYADGFIDRKQLGEKAGKASRDIELLNEELKKTTGQDFYAASDADILAQLDQMERICAAEMKTNAQLKSIISRIEVGKDGVVEIFFRQIGAL